MTFVRAGDRARELRARYLAAQGEQEVFTRLPHQIPPDEPWWFWLLEAGRGAGKSAGAAQHIAAHLNGPPCISDELPHRVSLIAPTLGDGIESAHLNDQSLTRIEPAAQFRQQRGGSRVIWPNGSQVRLFGTHTREDVERLRAGGNRCYVWAEELAAWRYLTEGWQHMMFGLRLGPAPKVVATTTPKARPAYRKVRALADVISHATTLDNPNLNPQQKQRLFDVYGDTSIGQQELYGRLIEEAEGAIWRQDQIEADRRPDLFDEWEQSDDEVPHPMDRIVVAVDPPGGATECGIVTAGRMSDCPCGGANQPHFAVVADVSGKLTPEGWGSRVVDQYREWSADRIVAEGNFGGDMVQSVIKNIDGSVSYKKVTASRGKRLRAEPILALYEQHRVHHVGRFEALESEMTLWEPDVSEWSPNRLDALVWALTELSAGRVMLTGDLMR
jgi:phage terminase large subunit-like protein